jgi:hypothetical protein
MYKGCTFYSQYAIHNYGLANIQGRVFSITKYHKYDVYTYSFNLEGPAIKETQHHSSTDKHSSTRENMGHQKKNSHD